MLGVVSLFVPASSPAMINSSLAFDADSLIFDLEDSVALSEKDSARELLREALISLDFRGKSVIVRINSINTDFWYKDLEYIKDTPAWAVMVPKAAPDAIRVVSEALDSLGSKLFIVPIVETALGVELLADILRMSPRVKGLLFGAEDYALDMGINRTKEGDEVLFARARIANAVHAFGVEGLDTPFTDVNDMEGLRADALRGKSLGFTGKAAISPRQIEVIREVYLPSREEVEFALRVVKAFKRSGGKGVFTVDGKMVDAPIVAKAKLTLRRAGVEVSELD